MSFLSDSDLKEIEKAVIEAEKKTSGEIVPVFVKSSSTTGHVFWMLGLIGLLFIYRFISEDEPLLDLALLIGAVVGAALLARVDSVKRFLIPLEDRIAQCDRRAELEFYENNLAHTDGDTGVMIFVSLLERRIVLLADKGINEKVGEAKWAELVADLEKDIKKGKVKDGFVKAITACGDILAQHFPRDPNDKNELHDHLVVKD